MKKTDSLYKSGIL